VTCETVDRDVRASSVNTQGLRQITAQRIQITLGLLDLGELLRTTGFRDEVDRQLVGSSSANEVRKVGQRQSWLRLLARLRQRCG